MLVDQAYNIVTNLEHEVPRQKNLSEQILTPR